MASGREQAKSNAQKMALADLDAGKTCNSARYGARPGSAWDKWYTEQYQSGEKEG